MKRVKAKLARSNQRAYFVVFGMLFAVTGALALVFTQAATIGSLTFQPSRNTIGVNETFTVRLISDSRSEEINAVQADVLYDADKLQLVSVDDKTETGASAFEFKVPQQLVSGRASLGFGTTKRLTGQQSLAVLTFKAIKSGPAQLRYDTSSVILRYADATNVLSERGTTLIDIADTTAPTVPNGLVQTGATLNSVALRWNPSTDNVGVTGYNIFRNGVKVGTSTTPSYTDAGLNPGTTYSYRVTAYDTRSNTSGASATVSMSTLVDSVAPSVPAGLRLVSNTNDTITFAWNASADNAGVTGYNIFRNGVKVGTSTATTFTDRGLRMGTSYAYTTSAYDARGNTSAQSAAVRLGTRTDTTPPSVPTGVSVGIKNSRVAVLRWNPSADNVGVTGYNIFRNGVKVGSVAGTSYEAGGLTISTTYSFTVQAYDAGGNTSAQTAPSRVSMQYKPGDVNDDGFVNLQDFSILAANYGKKGMTRVQGNLHTTGDTEGVVNIYDFSVLARYWEN